MIFKDKSASDGQYARKLAAAAFDPAFYLKTYADVRNSGADPLDHYLDRGWKEGRDPSPGFSTAHYLASYPDVQSGGTNPLIHYVLHGHAEGRKPSAKRAGRTAAMDRAIVIAAIEENFDAGYYLKTYPEVGRKRLRPIEHYVDTGWREGFNPSAKFDTAYYLQANADVGIVEVNPLYHYVRFGRRERRRTRPWSGLELRFLPVQAARRARSLWRRFGLWQAMRAAYEMGHSIPARPPELSGPGGLRLRIDRIAGSARGLTIAGSLTGGEDLPLSIDLGAGPLAQHRVAAVSGGRFETLFDVPPQTAGRLVFTAGAKRSKTSWTGMAEFDVRDCVAPGRRILGFCRFFWTAIAPRAFDFLRPGRRKAARRAISTALDAGRFAAGEGPIDARRHFAARAETALPADCIATVVVPVYNGYRHVKALLGDLRLSLPAPHRLVMVDDASSEAETAKLLAAAAGWKDFAGRISVLRNDRNRGFVASANRGLAEAKGHAILLNSDVRLPPDWIGRLLAPILADSAVASVTPFSNAATICSFPVTGADNPPFAGIALDRVDRHFKALDRRCADFAMPTGVGFCMAMNRRFLDAIGLFDAEAFGRGYGEENDWCQRAITAGGRNVMAPDLYVLHVHGGSFASAERRALIARNLRVLEERYGSYNADVRRFFAADPGRALRAMLLFRILAHEAGDDFEIAVDHEMGGGTTVYRERRIAARAGRGAASALVTCAAEDGSVAISFRHGGSDYRFQLAAWDQFDVLLPDGPRIHWVLNSAVGIARLSECLGYLTNRAGDHGNRLAVCLHDFYPVCPSYNLLDREGRYCGVPDLSTCAKCLPTNTHAHHAAGVLSRKDWHAAWATVLAAAQEIVAFSAASAAIFLKAYPHCKDRVVVRPHGKLKANGKLAALPARLRAGETVTIGVVGAIGYSKGAAAVIAAAKAIEAARLPAKITVIGKLAPGYSHPAIEFHGTYQPDDLPAILRDRAIHVAWVPSIWPETYCYVADELMAAGVPLACFDLGAPPERVRNYARGLVLSGMDPAHAVSQLIAHARRFM